MTLARKSELLNARWQDTDLAEGQWQIPAENTKTGKPYWVYLSTQAIALFEDLSALAGGSEWVLPGRASLEKPFCASALNKALGGVHFPMPPFG